MIAVMLGIAIGLVMGLTGAGGGILAVPALVFALGWTIPQAAPVALIAVAGAAFLGAVEGLRHGLVRYRAALLMGAVGILVAPLGLKVASIVSERVLLLGFALAMVLVSGKMFRDARSAVTTGDGGLPPCQLDPSTGRLHWTPLTAASLGSIGAVSGFFTGLLGVGGGFLIVPALRRFSDISMQGIVATSLAVIALVSTGSVIAAWLQTHHLPLAIAAPFAAGAAAGMVAGRIGAGRLSPPLLQRIFASVTGVVAIGLIARAAYQ